MALLATNARKDLARIGLASLAGAGWWPLQCRSLVAIALLAGRLPCKNPLGKKHSKYYKHHSKVYNFFVFYELDV